MKELNISLLNIEQGILCHQVNCKGKMGAGLALAIRRKWPQVYKEYMQLYEWSHLRLGLVQFVHVVPNSLIVANCCGQDDYGRDRCYTNYDALYQCFLTVGAFQRMMWNSDYFRTPPLPIYIPYGMGSTLAGGDWLRVRDLAKRTIPHATIVKYSGK